MDSQLLEAWLEADVELGRSLVHAWLEDSWKEAIGIPAGADQDISTLVRKMQVSTVAELADWCLQNIDIKSDCAKLFDRSREELIDCLGFELAVVADRFTYESASAFMEEKEDSLDPSMEAKKLAQELTLGWPEVSNEPVFVRASNRFVCSFPLEYPMGLADLHADRKFKVSSPEYNQHMIRHFSGAFVNGSRGHRVLWALVNSQLLEEARSKCCGVYRVAIKKVGGRVLGLAHITKGQLQNMLAYEQQARMLGHLQLPFLLVHLRCLNVDEVLVPSSNARVSLRQVLVLHLNLLLHHCRMIVALLQTAANPLICRNIPVATNT